MFLDQYPALQKKFLDRLERQEKRQAIREVKVKREEPSIKKIRKGLVRERFLRSAEWIEVRKAIFARDGRICAQCGSVERLQIDHIKPRSKFPELALEHTNLRVLCWPCNKKKAAKY